MRNVDRRGFLAGVAGVAALAAATAGQAEATTRRTDDPFTLGVASGDPTATGVVLWTRLAPRLFEPRGGMPDRKVTVDWQVASDDRFRRVVRSGTAWAVPGLAHSVHVEVDGLAPDREWFSSQPPRPPKRRRDVDQPATRTVSVTPVYANNMTRCPDMPQESSSLYQNFELAMSLNSTRRKSSSSKYGAPIM